jgi:hypothetical protein
MAEDTPRPYREYAEGEKPEKWLSFHVEQDPKEVKREAAEQLRETRAFLWKVFLASIVVTAAGVGVAFFSNAPKWGKITTGIVGALAAINGVVGGVMLRVMLWMWQRKHLE